MVGAMRPPTLIALLGALLGACGHSQHCAKPGKRATPRAERVSLPPVSLAGFMLGTELKDATRTCTNLRGTIVVRAPGTMTCTTSKGYVQLGLDDWDRVISVMVSDPSIRRDEAAASIDRALGHDGTFVERAEWPWNGGSVYLTTGPLTLRYERADLHERTVYGLPNCGVN